MGAGVSVPATSANLGPGFDSFGLALDLHNEFEAELADGWTVEVEGEGAGVLATDERNQVARAMRLAFRGGRTARAAAQRPVRQPHPAGQRPRLVVRRRSSAGCCSASGCSGEDPGSDRVLELAAGHRGSSRQRRCGDSRRLHRVLDRRGPAANRALRAGARPGGRGGRGDRRARDRRRRARCCPRRSRTPTPRSTSLTPGCSRPRSRPGRPELLGAALADRLHEPYRASAVGDLRAVHDILRSAGAAGVALSGAGPTVIGLVAADTDEAAHALAVEVAERAADGVRELADAPRTAGGPHRSAGRSAPVAPGSYGLARAGRSVLGLTDSGSRGEDTSQSLVSSPSRTPPSSTEAHMSFEDPQPARRLRIGDARHDPVRALRQRPPPAVPRRLPRGRASAARGYGCSSSR